MQTKSSRKLNASKRAPEGKAVSNYTGKCLLPHMQHWSQTVREFRRNKAMTNSQYPSPQSNLGIVRRDTSTDLICTSGNHKISGAKLRRAGWGSLSLQIHARGVVCCTAFPTLSHSNSCSRLFSSKLSIKLINDVLYIEVVHLTERLQQMKSCNKGWITWLMEYRICVSKEMVKVGGSLNVTKICLKFGIYMNLIPLLISVQLYLALLCVSTDI